MSDGVSLLQNGSRESSRHRKGMSAKAQLEGIGRPLGDTFSFKDIFYHRWAETIHSSPLSPIPPMCVDWTASGASTSGWTALPSGGRDAAAGAGAHRSDRGQRNRPDRWRVPVDRVESISPQFLPTLVHLDGPFVFVLDHRQPALFDGLAVLVVERLQLEVFAVVLVVRRVIFAGGDVDDLLGAAVVERTKAHRARTCEDVNFTVREVFGLEFLACFSHSKNFGMCRRVLGLRHKIRTFRDNFVITYDHRSERATTCLYIFHGQIDSALDTIPLKLKRSFDDVFHGQVLCGDFR